jgi:hypothetical protein
VPPAAVLPSLPIPAAVGQVTGMAVDPASKHLFVSNGASIFELDPIAGMAVVCMWPSTIAVPVTDVEFDPANPAEVFALDATGQILTYGRCGVLVAAMAPSYAAPVGMAVGLALDRSMPAGGALPFHVLWSSGNVYDQSLGAVHAGGFLNHAGLTFFASPIHLPSAGLCGGVKAQIRTSMPSIAGAAGFGFELGNVPAGTPFVALGVDLGLFGGPVALGGSGTLWVPGALASFVVFPGAGTAAMPLPLPGGGALLGLQVTGPVPAARVRPQRDDEEGRGGAGP